MLHTLLLFTTPIFFWGLSWYVITFQLGTTDPMVSTSLRFYIAAALLFLFAVFFSKNLRIKKSDHFPIFLQGMCLFGLNYWIFYVAQQYVTSGIVALLFSLIIFFNAINGFIFLKRKAEVKTIMFALLGMFGAFLVFKSEIANLSFGSKLFFGLALSLLATYTASLGNTLSYHNQSKGRGVFVTNAYGMLYGATGLLAIIIITGKPIEFNFTKTYVWSLLYLSVGASILAFGTYLSVLGKIGTAKAAYIFLIVPIIALSVSALLENYTFTLLSFSGSCIILLSCFSVLYEASKKLNARKKTSQSK